MPNLKRTMVEQFIIEHIDAIEPSGTNSARYKDMFSKMTDSDFEQMMLDVKDKKRKLVILYVPNMKINLKLANIFKVARAVKLNLFERINFYDEVTKRRYLTPHEYLVVRLPVRRLKQALMEKISVPDSDSKTDTFTGQVMKPDKGSAISSPEMQAILSKGLENCLHELINIRGGNLPAYADFKSQLQETGMASTGAIDTDSRVRSSVVLATYLRAMLLDTNLT